MLKFLKKRANDDSAGERAGLGPLETQVMRVLWRRGECSVHDVLEEIKQPLAYTTVMTTLDRLFKKQMLQRRRAGRAFLYSPCLPKAEWDKQMTDRLVERYVSGPQPMGELLVSSLVDALGSHHHELLDELEEKIQKKRKELARKERA